VFQARNVDNGLFFVPEHLLCYKREIDKWIKMGWWESK